MSDFRLDDYEWLTVGLLIIGICLFAGLAFYDDPPLVFLPKPEINSSPQTIQVSIEGAVQAPGDYILPKQATVKHLFELAKPLSSADTRRFKRSTILQNRRHIRIKEKKPSILK